MKSSAMLLCTALIFFSINTQAQDGAGRHLGRPKPKQKGPGKPSKYTMAQFDGRWQEVGRTDNKTNTSVTVKDTTYIRFYDGTKADTKQGASVVITGAAEVLKDDYITTSADDYKIVSLTGSEMVLDDEDGYIHTFSKMDQFAYERVTTPPVEAIDTSAAVVDLTPGSFTKSWFAYRRTASPGIITNQTAIIRDLKITSNTDNNNYKGEIEYSQRGKAIIKPCTIAIVDNKNATIVTDANTWNVIIYKCDGRELILGNKGDVVYYFKNNN